ncbi:MAG TPA: hypothetical protein VGS27_25435 [Candidatus Sulfotelmatobacter sp.]|nr:hypothetical protein [Candidatus Sulfotelmatobacter sp.]
MNRVFSFPMTPLEFGQAPILYLPFCPICNKPVSLETAKADEHGRAVHEECYLLSLKLKHETGA